MYYRDISMLQWMDDSSVKMTTIKYIYMSLTLLFRLWEALGILHFASILSEIVFWIFRDKYLEILSQFLFSYILCRHKMYLKTFALMRLIGMSSCLPACSTCACVCDQHKLEFLRWGFFSRISADSSLLVHS